ncbi:arabinose-5-phosphate isomerase [Clostridium saccharoperbutylacetonicum]|uniref:Putative sugar phosphate isomerase involved in capsule formation n=1 Tax=Clostridium saccharoperbutylacetonicum N1-4(HMT) TaxID=931276 RepID=M1MUG6_9CLOT|nr:SIS domain-containing protein [Clostridium saccharoperbutylacetonicum]AGF58316.1 putative sugar phosphate isomerase involved in capsule formation [Clostridium saccharoperbutylacetonicum N1-4(HMT)]NRT60907.1 arabinose-5-phosphate isomerase [Clostridium saccharoperbutylacetonicum]NSB24220.1 arabinose-5-phosphate isomerase [Clostridium saccharoperbutylacetonicum]NSB43598.1 arabinose-5-phosphate isomerase [Clostridium saccharoperbutylacetonicum]
MISYFEDLLKIISKSLDSVDEESFNRLVDESVNTLRSGKKIIVSGLGKNVPICEKFVGTMSSLGLNSCFLHTNSAIHGDIGVVHKDDLVIVLTKSGETSESVYLVKHLKMKDARLWLLSFCKKSTLTSMIEDIVILDLENEGDMWNIMPNNSTTLNLIILQALAMHIAMRMEIKLEDFKENHPGGHIGDLLKDE